MSLRLLSEPSISSSRVSAGRAPSLERIKMLVAVAFEVTLDELRQANRGCARAALARQCAMYLARVALGCPMKYITESFGRDRATVDHACRVVEDARDDPAIDALLAALEDQLQVGGAAE